MKKYSTLALCGFLGVTFLFVPISVRADSSFSISTEPQAVEVNAISSAVTVSASAAVSATTCLLVSSDSSAGQFSSGATAWNPVSVITMSKNTSNRSFYYKDSAEGSFTLTIKIAPKPDTVSASCSAWSEASSNVQATLTQPITIGAGGTQQEAHTSDPATSSSSVSTQPAQTVSVTSVGSETLQVKITTQPVVVVGAGSFASGAASDSHGPKGGIVRYIWNFGDGSTKEGQTTFHTYTYPGTYVLGLTVAAGDEAGMARTTVQAVAAQIGVLAQSDGSVVLSNQSRQELNIGLWSITSGTSTFTIPQDTILLGSQSLRFSTEVMHMVAGSDTTLRYANGAPVSATLLPIQNSVQPPPVSQPTPTTATAPVPETKTTTTPAAPNSATKKIVSTTSVSVAAVGATEVSVSWWVYGLGGAGLLFVGLGILAYTRPRWGGAKPETNIDSEEFDIE